RSIGLGLVSCRIPSKSRRSYAATSALLPNTASSCSYVSGGRYAPTCSASTPSRPGFGTPSLRHFTVVSKVHTRNRNGTDPSRERQADVVRRRIPCRTAQGSRREAELSGISGLH